MNGMVKNSSIAIITRTKNRNILLKRAITSVVNQSYNNWTHVIVNDGGVAQEVEKCVKGYVPKKFIDRVKVIHNPVSVGMEAASNIGINSSESTYIVIHDDDDSWHPDFLSKCLNYLDNNEISKGVVTHSDIVIEAVDGNEVNILSREPFNYWLKDVYLWRMLSSNVFPPISFVFSRDVMKEVGVFREDLPVLGDWDFHLRYLVHSDIGVIPEPLAFYHHRRGVLNGDLSNSVIGGDSKHSQYRKILKNEWLRNSFDGNLMGALSSISDSFEVVHSDFAQLRSQVLELDNKLNSILSKLYVLENNQHQILLRSVIKREITNLIRKFLRK